MGKSMVVSAKAVRELEEKLALHDRAIARQQQQRADVVRHIEAMRTLLGAAANGHGPTAAEKPSKSKPVAAAPHIEVVERPAGEVSLPQAVEQVVQKRGPLSAVEIRDAVIEAGVKREKLGATFSYLYTVLGRLEQRRRIVRVRGKYRLPEAINNTVIVPFTGGLKLS